jgi:DNA helicase-4
MPILLIILILFFAIVIGVNIRYKIIAKERKAKRALEEAERLRKIDENNSIQKKKLKIYLPLIDNFNIEYENFKNQNHYLSNFDIVSFKSKFEKLYNELKSKTYKHLPDFNLESKSIDSFNGIFNNLEKLIEIRNNDYVESEMIASDEIFSNVEGKSLDGQQRKAILVDEDNSLIIAGAGSGKTTTIAGKVKYLTEKLNIKPKNILLISFTRKSADEMKERIFENMDINIAVKTFHKLGLDIIAKANNERPSVFSLSQKEILQLLLSFFNHLKADKEYFDKLLDFLAYYLKPYKSLHDFSTDAEHNNYLKEQKLEGYKMVEKLTRDGVAIKYREKFKSQEEVLIANFLFRNNIEYTYEESYEHKTASKKFGQYKPDFYLPDYKIYIEHFGIDANGNVPKWFKGSAEKTAQQRYTEGIEWKRNEHQFNNTTLVETYSWEQKKNVLLPNLQEKLESHGVLFTPMSDEELWEYMNENTKEDIDIFTQLVNTFLVLFKSNNETLKNLVNKARKEENQRAVLFLKLFEPILKHYESYLKEKNEIDFSDMINMATESINNTAFVSQYKYIIIDEFQDISQSRYQLIKALLDQKPATKLFCVGDDWQSIYRFAGSDIGVFTEFAEYFKPSTVPGFQRKTQISYIENTYRFNNQIIEVSSNFILKNPNQLEKTLKTNKFSTEKPVSIHRYDDRERDGKFTNIALNKALNAINQAEVNKEVSILILGRYDFERRVLDNSSSFRKKYNNELNIYDYIYKDNENFKINFLTVHSAKGLQADYVVILNGNSGTYGFPSEISDDPLLSFLLSKADQFPNGEERRLFYVALTRAKNHIHILSSNDYPSKFVEEIEENAPITSIKCEWCDNGKLLERKGPFGYFYSCNNSHYCNFTKGINANDLYSNGHKYFVANEYDNAFLYFEKALSMDYSMVSAHYYIARCYDKKENVINALKHYDAAVELGYDKIEVFYNRGIIYSKLKDYNKAIEDFLKVEQNKPNIFSVNLWIAIAYYKARYVIIALEYLEKELSINPLNETAISIQNQIKQSLKERYTTKEVKVRSEELKTIKGYITLAKEFEVNVKFNYQKSVQFEGGLQSLRTIKPKEFKLVGNSECVVGYCYLRKEDRTFNIDRISNLIINPNTIEFWSEE